MFDQIRNLFSGSRDAELESLVKNGAQVVDVRSRAEFAAGHMKGSINIPLQELDRNLSRIKRDQAVIVCCASGARSASAKGILESHGYRAYNGGTWRGLENKAKK
jgi:rhodanese-related sulfurtransferase